MKPDEKALRFFLGANTPQGFVSRFDQLADVGEGWRAMIIKGGPGSGKSTMMKRIADKLEETCGCIERIHCSSDVDSLDGVIVPELRFSIADGTLPHGWAYFIIKMITPLRSRQTQLLTEDTISMMNTRELSASTLVRGPFCE